ncbi:cytochrome c3 family protein [Shewanella sedimentimangrovi]|uniref:Cytochrome c3 family protein n=1 Tax=Shewanella sedimentimangrovi TaxID=2814293 RepID=A0ABX7R2I1_9GAMM|nr:cytochrome c3 family protein [Shewanella sedimentimangrovi]QSX37699.1 cytochrome c3 family protein [Shewanella sedimentimangrovi]
MKNLLKLSVAVATVLMAGNAMATQNKSIVDSKHNLGSTSVASPTNQRNKTDATTEVCVFCHTPHGGVAKSGGETVAPLWNKTLPSSATFSTYSTLGTATLQGTVKSVGSVSIACLSCHDGSQAMDVMINQPGSGNYKADRGALEGLGGTWTQYGTNINTTTGQMETTNPVPGLGTDLTNDHPIGIQYAGGLITGKTNADRGNSSAYKNQDFRGLTSTTINGNTVWYVAVGATNDTTGLTNQVAGSDITPVSGIRNKTDMALYTRTEGGVDQPFVECASCHDPHQADTATFLRIDNRGSAVCLACHVK